MTTMLYIAGAIAILATVMTITRLNAVHALLYFIVSLLAIAVVFFTLGAPFVAALEVIIYAGAIMVLFVFVIMILNLGPHAAGRERKWFAHMPVGPGIVILLLLAETVYAALQSGETRTGISAMPPQAVSVALFGPYLIGVELASFLLLTGLVVAYHLGRTRRLERPEGGL